MRKNQLTIKPRFIAFVAATVDGRISLTNKTSPDWTSAEDWKFFQKFLSKADAVIVGRNTYKAAAARLNKRNTYVISRHPERIYKKKNVTFLNPNKVNLLEIFSGYKIVAILGGNAIYGLMLKKNLLDEIFVTIEPLIFGRGKEMIRDVGKIKHLQLLSVKRLNKEGTLLLHYQVNKP